MTIQEKIEGAVKGFRSMLLTDKISVQDAFGRIYTGAWRFGAENPDEVRIYILEEMGDDDYAEVVEFGETYEEIMTASCEHFEAVLFGLTEVEVLIKNLVLASMFEGVSTADALSE